MDQPAGELAAVGVAAAEEAGGVDVTLLGDYLQSLASASAAGTRLDANALAQCRKLGGRAAEEAVP